MKTVSSHLIYRVSLVVVGIGMLAGCNSQPSENPVVESPPPPSSVNTSAPEATQTPRISYQVVTEFIAKSNVVFTVDVNGTTIGSYSTDKAQNDITNSLRDGSNDVKVSWTADPSMPAYGTARIKLQSQSDGKWNDVMTREVRRDTAAGTTSINLQVGEAVGQSSPETAPATEANVATDSVDNSTNTALPGDGNAAADAVPTVAAISDTYQLKTTYSSLAPGSFDVSINGQTVGSYNSASNRDISSYLKPGANEVTVAWQASKAIKNQFAESKLTIGVLRDGKWSTVANQAINKAEPSGKRTWNINVQ